MFSFFIISITFSILIKPLNFSFIYLDFFITILADFYLFSLMIDFISMITFPSAARVFAFKPGIDFFHFLTFQLYFIAHFCCSIWQSPRRIASLMS